MTSVAFRLLKKVAKRGELSLKDAIEFPKAPLDHTAQYPLALLIEEGYLGSTLDHQPPVWSRKDARVFSRGFPSHVHPSERQQRRSSLSRCSAAGCPVERQCRPGPGASFLEGEGGALLGPVRTKTLGSFLGVSFRGRRGRDRGASFSGLEEETRSPVRSCFTKGRF